ncbi:Enolase [Arachis hypogaea]|nr:Enolase [Arachis hypogaea]
MFVVVSEGVSDCLQPPPATRAIDVLNFTPLNNKPSKKKKEMLDKFCETPFYLKLLKEHVVGDGLLMSNAKLIERAVLEYACNVLLLKVTDYKKWTDHYGCNAFFPLFFLCL